MTTVVFLDQHRPKAADAKPVPVTEFLGDLSAKTKELSEDWLFKAVGEQTKRRMLAERGIALEA